MPLQGAAKAPTDVAVLGTAAVQVDLSLWDGATAFPTAAEAADIQDALDALQAKLDALIVSLKDGRVAQYTG